MDLLYEMCSGILDRSTTGAARWTFARTTREAVRGRHPKAPCEGQLKQGHRERRPLEGFRREVEKRGCKSKPALMMPQRCKFEYCELISLKCMRPWPLLVSWTRRSWSPVDPGPQPQAP